MRRSIELISLVAIAAIGSAAAMNASLPLTRFGQSRGGTTSAQTAASPSPTGGFSSANAWTHLRQMVAIGPRVAGSAELARTREYITKQLSSYGLTVQPQAFQAQTPFGPKAMVNLIVTLKGQRPDRVVFTGHYDTKLERNFTFVGASDGASSAAMLIELARVLKDRPRTFTYEFIWFDGEEAFCEGWDECGKPGSPDNTYGSRHYLQQAINAHTTASIHAMILVDMIGAGNLRILRESDSTLWLTDAVWNAAKRLGQSAVFVDASAEVTDDHTDWLKAGIPCVDIIDLMDYPQWHTAADDLAHVSARSLQIVGDVILGALPEIERHQGRYP
jgi:hypothetical protein